MVCEFMTLTTLMPPCMPIPRVLTQLSISNTAKLMYSRMLDVILTDGIEDENGILFIRFPIMELAKAISRSSMTVKRSLNELEDTGLVRRVRQNVGEPSRIYVLVPMNEENEYE